MGLHDSLLNVPERLRVWQQAGVRYFYMDEHPSAKASPLADAAPVPSESDRHAGQAASGQPADDVLPTTAAVFEESSPKAPVPADPAAWPSPWPRIFAKAPPKPRLVITYAELGLDLTGQADARRGNLWRKLISDLGLAGQNAVAFWPVALPGSDQHSQDLDYFVAGLALLAPESLAIFGDAAAGLLQPRASALAGIALIRFADPETFLRNDTEAWNHVLSVLGNW